MNPFGDRGAMACWAIGMLVVWSGVLMRPTLHAQSPKLTSYSVTTWSAKDGIPSSVIFSLVQDDMGYIWLGTNEGLARFDGAEFRPVTTIGATAVPSGSVRSLRITRSGDLWFGSLSGQVSRIHNGQLVLFDVAARFNPGIINGFAEDRQGRVWVGTDHGILLYENDNWRHIGADLGLPEGRIDDPYIDRAGKLFVGTQYGIFSASPGQEFHPVDRHGESAKFRRFAEDKQGNLWVSDTLQGFRRLEEKQRLCCNRRDVRGNEILFDRNGDLWVATMDQGLWRVGQSTGEIEKFAVPGARSILEDRDGNIWAGTGSGLYRLSRAPVSSISELGPVTSVAATRDGDVWLSTSNDLLHLPHGDYKQAASVMHAQVTALHATNAGALWLTTDGTLMSIDGKKRRQWNLASLRLARITTLTADEHGHVYMAGDAPGVSLFDAATGQSTRLLTQGNVSSLYLDHQGNLWLGWLDGSVSRRAADGTWTNASQMDGLDGADHHFFLEDLEGRIWVSSADRLFLWRDGRFIPVDTAGRGPRGASSMVLDANGNLWLTSRSGVERILQRDIATALQSSPVLVHGRFLDGSDGMLGMPIWFHSNGAARSSDGRIWFVTGSGVSLLWPQTVNAKVLASRAEISSVHVDDKLLAPGDALRKRPDRLQISYSAVRPSQTHPIGFRYRLVGLDNNWIEAASQRQAVYTHLPPRKYRFEVMASNDDGTWSTVPATWDFSVPPAFYQTRWFYALGVMLTLGCIWLAAHMHERTLRKEFSLKLAERMRLSRELHDTLLQSLVAVALHFNAAADSIPPSSPVHQRLVRIRKQVEEGIREARQSIQSLRSPALMNQDLTSALREAMEEATRYKSVRSRLSVQGRPYHAPAIVEQQLLRIGQEAILNAVRHAQASELKVALNFEQRAITLRVVDDGCGFIPSPQQSEQDGHYGLRIMEERATQVDGAFRVTTAIHVGTTVETTVPVHPRRHAGLNT